MTKIDDERLIATVKSAAGRRETRVSILRKDRHLHLDIRGWYRADDGSVMRPSKLGLQIPLEHLPDMADAISLALEKARQWGLVQ